MKSYKFLNNDYVVKVYDSYNFDFDNNYYNVIQNLSKLGSLTELKLYELDILREELDDYLSEYRSKLIYDDMVNECHIMFNEIIDDVEYDLL